MRHEPYFVNKKLYARILARRPLSNLRPDRRLYLPWGAGRAGPADPGLVLLKADQDRGVHRQGCPSHAGKAIAA